MSMLGIGYILLCTKILYYFTCIEKCDKLSRHVLHEYHRLERNATLTMSDFPVYINLRKVLAEQEVTQTVYHTHSN